jgi:hypothetical protein
MKKAFPAYCRQKVCVLLAQEIYALHNKMKYFVGASLQQTTSVVVFNLKQRR